MLYRASLLYSFDLGYTFCVSLPFGRQRSPRNANVLTSYRICLSALFATCDEDNILLRSVDVVVLQEEDTIDAILLQRRELDKSLDWADK